MKTMTAVVIKTYFCFVQKVVGGFGLLCRRSYFDVNSIKLPHFQLFLHLLATFIIKRALITLGPSAHFEFSPNTLTRPGIFCRLYVTTLVASPQYLQYQHSVIKVNSLIELCVEFLKFSTFHWNQRHESLRTANVQWFLSQDVRIDQIRYIQISSLIWYWLAM